MSKVTYYFKKYSQVLQDAPKFLEHIVGPERLILKL
jgi:hypothetical protein